MSARETIRAIRDELGQLFLERADVREQFERIRSDEATPRNSQREVTGGTTNEPLRILRDARAQHRTLAWRLYRWWGVEPSENQAFIWRETSFERWRSPSPRHTRTSPGDIPSSRWPTTACSRP